MTDILNIHATAVAIRGIGILLRGPSGSGKSDLALRLIDQGSILIADDRVDLSVRAGKLYASPPQSLAGLIEARGIGVVRTPWLSEVPVGLLVDLVAPDAPPRLPGSEKLEMMGILLPYLKLDPWPASAALKLRLAVGQSLLDN